MVATDFSKIRPVQFSRRNASVTMVRGLSFSSEWGGGPWKSWGVRIFSWEIGGSQKNQEIFGWLQILMKILFNKIAPKMHIFCPTRIAGYMFLQHCSSGGGSWSFWSSNRGVTKILPRYFRKFMTPPFQKNAGPLTIEFFLDSITKIWFY